jgi:hypothetical protein
LAEVNEKQTDAGCPLHQSGLSLEVIRFSAVFGLDPF